MTDHTNHAAPRPAPRRLLWAAWLAAVVLTSLGHSASTTYPGADTTPPLPEACKPGTEQIIPLGQAQSGYVGTPLGQSLALRFTCAGTYGRPFAGDPPRELIWQVVSGGGTIDGVTQIAASTVINSTFGFGQSTVNWTLGPGVVGTQTVTATVDGRVFTFLATAAPPGDGSGECSDPATLNGTVFDEQRVIRAPEVWTLAG
ncbi:MAG: hypothetical protein RL375_593, partial [Pseudomonadota bacterium]